MNTAASVLLFRILHVVILFFFGLILLCEYLNIFCREPYSLGVFTALHCKLCLRKDRRPFSVCQSINFKERTRPQISTGVPQASHNHRSSLLLVCIWSQNSLGSDFTFYPVLKGSSSVDLRGASLGIWRAKDGVRDCSKTVVPQGHQLWPWQLYAAPKFIPS